MTDLITIRKCKPGRADRGVVVDDEVEKMLAANAAVAVGVSGGKDSCALAFATWDHLDSIGHIGPRVLIHSDLGRVEWKDSLPTCVRLADRLSAELVVVRREAGDMMDRWRARWESSVERYANLECVKLILPWSTPSMRFCTSELKAAPIARDLQHRFPGKAIISASGIRRDESSKRKLAPISKANTRLESKKRATWGVDWHPILEWSTGDVVARLDHARFDLHEAYTRYNMSRVSCAFCIMSNIDDLRASTTCPDNAEIYREMVQLEVDSTFAFQAKWLADVAPQLLDTSTLEAVETAKWRAKEREAAEAWLPDHLLYTKGWPTVLPTLAEAEKIAAMRERVADVVGLEVCHYTTAESVRDRYAELMTMSRAR